MSWELFKQVRADDSITNHIDYAVLLEIAFRYDPEGGCFQDEETLAKQLRLSVRTFRRSISRLQEARHLQKKQGGKGQGDRNYYTPTPKLKNPKIIQGTFPGSDGDAEPVAAPSAPPKKVRQSKAFVAPTLEEMVAFAKDHQIPQSDAEKLHEIWTASEWHNLQGKPIKNWKGTLVSWKANGYLPSQKAAKNNAAFTKQSEEQRTRDELKKYHR